MESTNIPSRLVPLGRIIAFKFWELTIKDDPRVSLSISDFRGLFSITISSRQIEAALEVLCEAKSFYRGRAGAVPSASTRSYRILPAGVQFVEAELGRRDSDLAYLRTYGDRVIEEIAGIDSEWLTSDERRVRSNWEPIDLDRSSSSYTDAVTATEEALESIRSSNEYAVDLPEQQRGIIGAIENGLDWLKNRRPIKAQLVDYLLTPLRFIAVQFAKASMGDLAARAIELLVKLIGSVS